MIVDWLLKISVAAIVALILITTVYLIDSIGTTPTSNVVEVTGHDYSPPYVTLVTSGYTTVPIYHDEVYKLLTPVPCSVTESVYESTKVGDKIKVEVRSGLLFRTNKYCKFLRKHHE